MYEKIGIDASLEQNSTIVDDDPLIIKLDEFGLSNKYQRVR